MSPFELCFSVLQEESAVIIRHLCRWWEQSEADKGTAVWHTFHDSPEWKASFHACHLLDYFLRAGEESGLLGSEYFTENPLIPLENIKYVINFDLLGGGNDGIMLVNSTEGKGLELYKRLIEINEESQLLPKIAQRPNAANSDHYFFTKNKVPAIFMYTMGGKTGAYHDISDTNENCTLTMFDNIFKLFSTLIEKEE